MKAEYDFSKGERGKFYQPKAVFNLPIYLEKDVDEFMRKLANEKGKDVEEIVNEWLRGKMQLTLKKHIEDIRDKLKKSEFPNEAAVSDGIVRRLLNALDWPIFNTQVVYPEYRVEGGRVDFALCHPPSKPIVFIEVKRVGKIEWADQQLFEYALDYGGIPIAVLTDGQKWRFFYQVGQENYREGKVRELDFIEGDSGKIADCLNTYLSYQSIRTGEAIRTIREDYRKVCQQRQVIKCLSETDNPLLDLVTEKIENLCGYKPTNEQALDFQKSLERKTKSKSAPLILPKSCPVIVPPNVKDHEVFTKAAWEVAYMRWGNRRQGPVLWEDVKEMIPSTQFSLESILMSDFYAHYVKHLMQTDYDTTDKFYKWVHSFKNMPKTFGIIMGLSPERVEQVVDEVKKEHNSTTREDNKDVKSENT